MARYLSWLANTALLGLCCFLVANATNAVFAAWLAPAPAEVAPAAAPAAAAGRSWQDRQVILARNLFNASLLVPAQSEAVEQNLEASKLPLELLGTVASPDPRLSWAAVEDQETHKHLVLQIDDDVKEGQATVMRIERRRIVLSENGTLRELVLEEDSQGGPPSLERVADRTRRQPRAGRRRGSRTQRPFEGLGSPLQLLSQANILPKFEEGEMIGLQLSGIEPGSDLEQAGFKDGDVITELNGIQINSPDEMAKLMPELSAGGPKTVTVKTSDGEVETRTFNP